MKDKVTRYYSKDIKNAVGFALELNKKEIVQDGKLKRWRVAVRINNKICFDIDNFDIDNLHRISNYYTPIFGRLRAFKTYHGFHFFTENIYTDSLKWQYDTCRVLYPLLDTKDLQFYIEEINKWYVEQLQKEKVLGQNREEFIEGIKSAFPQSPLYCGIGDFDILFAINVILKGYYCVRISKKAENDKPVMIQL